MKKIVGYLVCAVLCSVLLSTCASSSTGRGGNLSLMNAIEQSAQQIAADLAGVPQENRRVAVVAFSSHSPGLSDYIMEELTGALFDRNIEVADRQNIPYLVRELNFQMSGAVSDESAASLGKFLAAELVITGQLRDLGGTYRLMTTAVRVETAVRASVPRFDVRNDRAMQNMVAALNRQTLTVQEASYGEAPPTVAAQPAGGGQETLTIGALAPSRFSVTADTVPQNAGGFLDRGIMFASRGEYANAIADFTEALRRNPNMVGAYRLRGRALYASVSYITSIGEDFSGVGTASLVGTSIQITAAQMRAYEEAIADFTSVIRLDPNNAHSHFERGRVYRDKGDFDRAIADFNQAIRLNPNDAAAYNSRGTVHRQRGNLDQAIADLDQAIRFDPNGAIAYNNRGLVHKDRGNFDQAIADFNLAIRLDPNDASAYINRGLAHSDRGNLDQAIADYTSAIRLDPNRAVAYSNRGAVHRQRGNLDLAIADYNQAIRLNPNYAIPYFNRGSVYFFHNGDLIRAIADFDQAIRLNPNYAAAYNSRGAAYAENGDLTRAIADFEAALRIDPNYGDARRNLERARQMRGY